MQGAVRPVCGAVVCGGGYVAMQVVTVMVVCVCVVAMGGDASVDVVA